MVWDNLSIKYFLISMHLIKINGDRIRGRMMYQERYELFSLLSTLWKACMNTKTNSLFVFICALFVLFIAGNPNQDSSNSTRSNSRLVETLVVFFTTTILHLTIVIMNNINMCNQQCYQFRRSRSYLMLKIFGKKVK